MKNLSCQLVAKQAGLQGYDIKRLSEIARVTASKASNVLMEHYGNLKNISNKGRVGDLITDADIAAENIILANLNQ